MPNFDKTGPNGDGPQTGQGRGIKRPQQGQKPQDGRGQGKGHRQGKNK